VADEIFGRGTIACHDVDDLIRRFTPAGGVLYGSPTVSPVTRLVGLAPLREVAVLECYFFVSTRRRVHIEMRRTGR